MRALITYYSFSGNTEKVAQVFTEVLKGRGDCDVQRLRPRPEITTFMAQCRAAFTGKRAELEGGVKFDVRDYDLLIVGSPVWAFAPAPAINAFLDNVSGLAGKKAIIVLTSGSGAGVNRTFSAIERALKKKGAAETLRLNIKDTEVNDKALITPLVERLL
jgi:flavodoxin